MKLIVLLLVACVGAAPAKRSLTKEQTREVYKSVLDVLRKRHLENKRILDKKMVTEIPLTEEPTEFEEQVLQKLNRMNQGIDALHISPLFTQIVETLDNLESLCKHVMKIPHGDGHHEEHNNSGEDHGNHGEETSSPSSEETGPPSSEETGLPSFEETGPPSSEETSPPPAEETNTLPAEETSPPPKTLAIEWKAKRELLEKILSALQNGDRKKRSGDRHKRNVWEDVDWHLIGKVCYTFDKTKWEADYAFDNYIEHY